MEAKFIGIACLLSVLTEISLALADDKAGASNSSVENGTFQQQGVIFFCLPSNTSFSFMTLPILRRWDALVNIVTVISLKFQKRTELNTVNS